MDAANPQAALAALAAQSGGGLAALSRMLGRNEAYLQQFIRRGSPRRLSERDRQLLAQYFGVDEAVFGAPTSTRAGEMVAVRRLAGAASAGPGGVVEDDRTLGQARFDRAVLAGLGVRPGNVSMLRADGDSMSPLIEHGDQMLVDESDRTVTASAAVFVLRLDGALMVKSVSREGRKLRIASRNPAYPAVPLQHAADVSIIGRVVWLSRALR